MGKPGAVFFLLVDTIFFQIEKRTRMSWSIRFSIIGHWDSLVSFLITWSFYSFSCFISRDNWSSQTTEQRLTTCCLSEFDRCAFSFFIWLWNSVVGLLFPMQFACTTTMEKMFLYDNNWRKKGTGEKKSLFLSLDSLFQFLYSKMAKEKSFVSPVPFQDLFFIAWKKVHSEKIK